MKRSLIPATALVLASMIPIGSGTQAQAVPPVPPSPCSTSLPARGPSAYQLVQGNNAFGLRLLNRLIAPHPQANVFLSPVSAALDLEMAANGARGNTQRAMLTTLGLTGLTPIQVRARAASLVAALRSYDPKVKLSVANSLWARSDLPLRAAFVQQAEHNFGAKVAHLDFTAPDAPATINSWVSCATHGTIRQIVGTISPETVLYLINAVYFHALWTSPFQKADTYKQPFTVGTGARLRVPLMHQTLYAPYYGGSQFQAISLPYGRGRFSMAVLLPHPGIAVSTLVRQLTPATWNGWMGHLKTGPVILALPKFTLHNSFDLVRPLTDLGMGEAFGGDFSGMCTGPCTISDVLQKTYLRVYERGTEAAAVTSIVMAGGGYQPTPPPHMTVDHPFLVAIRDRVTGALLFIGAINDPHAT